MSRLPPHAARIARLVRQVEAPLVRFCPWPWCGGAAIPRALEAELGARLLPTENPAGGDLAAAIRAVGTSDPAAVFVASVGSTPTSDVLDAALTELDRGQVLVWVDVEAHPLGVVPVVTHGPRVLCLERGEVAARVDRHFGRRDDALVETLLVATGGWLGPVDWILGRLAASPDAAAPSAVADLLRGEELRHELEERVLVVLGDELAGVVSDLATVGDLASDCGGDAESELEDGGALDLWRVAWMDRPRRLAAFERALHRHALVPVPSLLEGLASPERRSLLLRRLAAAALGLERREQAIGLLRRAGAGSTAERLQHAVTAPSRRAPSPGSGFASNDGIVDASAPRTAMDRPTIELRLLGPPSARRLEVNGETHELRWRLRKAFQAVAFLALAPSRRASKDDLVEAVWSGVEPDAVRRNFHPTLSDARRTLEGPDAGSTGSGTGGIVYGEGLYRLDPELTWRVDVLEMLASAERGRHLDEEARAARRHEEAEHASQAALTALRHAWSLYRGPLLDAMRGDWLRAPREAAQRAHLDVLRRTGHVARRLGYDTLALDAYRSLLIEEPYEEQIHLAVMELYSRLGRRDLVRRQYLRLQDLLDELHVEPTDAARERYHQLMG
ncbi:MAG: BTAD domain-containing putative transcriptional regulator [Acidobacteriota bacterium]